MVAELGDVQVAGAVGGNRERLAELPRPATGDPGLTGRGADLEAGAAARVDVEAERALEGSLGVEDRDPGVVVLGDVEISRGIEPGTVGPAQLAGAVAGDPGLAARRADLEARAAARVDVEAEGALEGSLGIPVGDARVRLLGDAQLARRIDGDAERAGELTRPASRYAGAVLA